MTGTVRVSTFSKPRADTEEKLRAEDDGGLSFDVHHKKHRCELRIDTPTNNNQRGPAGGRISPKDNPEALGTPGGWTERAALQGGSFSSGLSFAIENSGKEMFTT